MHSTAGVAGALATQYLPPDALRRLQRRRLRRMLRHCARHVPFYRALWSEAGVEPDDVHALEDLRRLPIPDRRVLEEEPERLVAAPFAALHRAGGGVMRRSGGSSGGPQLEVHADPRSWSRLDAYYFRALAAIGYGPFTPMAYFWGAALPRGPIHKLGLMPKIGVPAHMDEDGQMLILEQNPGVWWYYHPTSLFALARRFGDRLAGARPARIVSHAELLPDSMRAAIERAAGAPVYDQWGTSEFNRMAWECPVRDGYHVDVESVILEILDDDDRPVRPGERGRAVVTGLVNRMMPLIRYELGDLVVASDRRCPCGRTLPMIERLEGRVKDVVTLPDGGTRTARELLEALCAVEGVEQLRVTFGEDGGAALELVPTRSEPGPLAEDARRRFAKVAPGIPLSVATVASLPKAPTGKRVMLSHQAAGARARGRARFVL